MGKGAVENVSTTLPRGVNPHQAARSCGYAARVTRYGMVQVCVDTQRNAALAARGKNMGTQQETKTGKIEKVPNKC